MATSGRVLDPERGVRARAVVAVMGIAVAFSLLSARLIYLQVVRAEELTGKAVKERTAVLPLTAYRGMISDRHGEILARDQPVSNVYADRFHLRDIGVASRGLAKATGVSAADILQSFSPDEIREKYLERVAEELHRPLGMHRWELMRKLTEPDKQEIPLAKDLNDRDSDDLEKLMREKRIGGIYLRGTLKRYYPVDGRAMHVVGFVNSSNFGQEGVEGTMNDVLTGKDGFREVERDRQGRELAGHQGKTEPPVHGSHVTLTLDMRVQDILEEALDNAVGRYQPERVIGVVTDPVTGEILAMANRPDYRRETSDGNRRNFAVSDTYEPGSTFKIVTVGGVFDLGLASPTTSVFCHNGYYDDSSLPTPLKDHHPYGDLTVTGILAKSSNIGTYKLARQLGGRNLYRYALAFGFGQKTQIPLNSEATGEVHPPEEWSGTTLSRMGIGYEVSVTPLQMAMAMGAIANGGTLMRPMLLRSIEDGTGQTVREYRPEALRRVINEEAAHSLRNAMVQVTQEGGTGTQGRVEGFRVAGKTGTARKFDVATRRYSQGEYVVSFAGFLPADNPRLAVIVVVDDPKVPASERFGGTVAGPVFSEIASRSLEVLGVPRAPALVKEPSAKPARAVPAPDITPITAEP